MRSIQKLFYKLFDSFSVGQLLAVAMSTVLVGIGVLIVLDSAEETPGLNVTELVNDSDENETKVCVPPYRDMACYPVENGSVNASLSSYHENKLNTTNVSNTTG
jgi:hypothetical protein